MNRTLTTLLLFALLLLTTATAANAELLNRELVIYQRDLAQVREVHTVKLAGGEETVTLGGILRSIDPGSVELSVLSGRGIETRAVSYAGNLFDFERYWNALLGNEVTLSVGDSSVSGILRRITGMNLFLEGAEGVLTPVSRGTAEDNRVIESLPTGVVTVPSLLWTVDAKRSTTAKIEISYLASGLSWKGEHKLLLDGKKVEVTSFATVSGPGSESIEYDRLTFVGGDVHMAGDQRKVDRLNPKPGASTSDSGSRFGQLRRWTIETPGTLYAGTETSFELTHAKTSGAETKYVYDASIYDDRVYAKLELTLDQALAAGEVRVYEKRDGGEWLTGSDRIDGTPPGSPLELTLAQAFDLTAERTRTVEKSAADEDTWQNFQVLLGNSGANDVTVRVLERTFGEWSIHQAELDSRPIIMTKLDARTAAFDVPVPTGKTVKLCYEIRYER